MSNIHFYSNILNNNTGNNVFYANYPKQCSILKSFTVTFYNINAMRKLISHMKVFNTVNCCMSPRETYTRYLVDSD